MGKKLSMMLMLGSMALVTGGLVSPGQAAYAFCRQASCHDGADPQSPLLQDGNFLYGVTDAGGAHQHGVVFRYTISTGAYKVLYSFCSTTNINGWCSDGDAANGALIIDTSGNLYGTTYYGGLADAGMVYELVKPVGTGSWTFTALHTFFANGAGGNGPDGGLSYVGQATTKYDGSSQLFGETIVGGGGGVGNQGTGTVFTLRKSGGSWQEEDVRIFCPTCSDGLEPYGGLYVDASSNLWGTTLTGGSTSNGLAFELTPGADHWTVPWGETVLYNFCWANGANCPDGSGPKGVTMDAAGNLVGTADGGTHGVLFKLTNGNCKEGGTQTFWCNSVLHTFSAAQGSSPNGNLVIDSTGNIFGTSGRGGSSVIVPGGAGTVWEQSGSTLSVLHTFCQAAGCTDGQYPEGGVIIDSPGDLWGTTSEGGDGVNGDGLLYETTP
ncbi:MAG TPA: choice-of-anchor tandem repeat GloVer-containing protein [Rhizomicrobium sp.]|jgi:uncharacterized repeat protein (TIGR03803 family)